VINFSVKSLSQNALSRNQHEVVPDEEEAAGTQTSKPKGEPASHSQQQLPRVQPFGHQSVPDLYQTGANWAANDEEMRQLQMAILESQQQAQNRNDRSLSPKNDGKM
jgi:hypothetical protein